MRSYNLEVNGDDSPSASPPSCTWFAFSLLFSLSLYLAVIAPSYGNLPESIFYTSRIFFRLNFSPRDGRYGWLSGHRENATSNTGHTKKSVSFRVAKVDYWFHGRVFEQPCHVRRHRIALRRTAPRHAMPCHAMPCHAIPGASRRGIGNFSVPDPGLTAHALESNSKSAASRSS